MWDVLHAVFPGLGSTAALESEVSVELRFTQLKAASRTFLLQAIRVDGGS